MFFSVDNFKDLVKNMWMSYDVKGFPSSVLASKLDCLREDLKVINKGC